MQLRREVENPIITPFLVRKYTEPARAFEETCSVCECRAKVKIHGERYCWDCAEVEGVEKV